MCICLSCNTQVCDREFSNLFLPPPPPPRHPSSSPQFERDIMIWNNKQYVAKPLLLKEDAAIQRHRRWFAQFYSPNSIKVPCQRDELAW